MGGANLGANRAAIVFSQDSAPFTIFVLDDDADLCAALRFSFELDGFAVETFESGEALAQWRDFPKNGCLVLDYWLPGMNGLDTLEVLRGREVELPAILITSNPRRYVRLRAAANGVRIIEKPLLSNALVDLIRRIDPRSAAEP